MTKIKNTQDARPGMRLAAVEGARDSNPKSLRLQVFKTYRVHILNSPESLKYFYCPLTYDYQNNP
jgi:hypothetical protein